MPDVIGSAVIDVSARAENVGQEIATEIRQSESRVTAVAVALGTAAGAAIVAGIEGISSSISSAFTDALEFDSAASTLEARLSLTSKRSEELGALAGELYADAYGENIGQVTEAIDSVVSSIDGMKTANASVVKQMTADVLNLSTAFELDLGQATGAAGRLINSGLAKDGVEAVDLLANTLSRVPRETREEIVSAVSEYAPFFDTLGLDGAQAMQLLAKGAENGVIGVDKVGDAIKEFTIRATDLSTGTKDAFKTIGVDMTRMTNDILAGGTKSEAAFEKIVGGLLKIKDPGKQAEAAIALFGTPLEDLAVSEIPAFLKGLSNIDADMSDVAGAAEDLGKQLNDNAKTDMTAFFRSAQQVFIDLLANKVIPVVRDLAVWLRNNIGPAVAFVTELLKSLVAGLQQAYIWFQQNQTIITIVAGVIAAIFIPHLIALGLAAVKNIGLAIASWITLQAQTIAAAAAHSLSIAKMVAGWILMGAQATIAGLKIAAAWLLAMGPIPLIIAAIVGLVTLIVTNWEYIADFLGMIWEGIKTAAEAVWNGIKWAIQKVVDFLVWLFMNLTIPGLIIKHWDTIKRVTSQVWNAISNFVKAAIDRVKGFINGAKNIILSIGNFFKTARDNVVKWITGIVDWVKGLPGKIRSAFQSLGEIIMAPFKAGFNAIARLWNNTVGRINFTIPSWVPVIGGNSFGIPKIPELAEGGIAMGPTLAMIGEGGQPEVIAPLDKLEAMMGGNMGGGGGTIIVNVNAGMVADPHGLQQMVTQQLSNLQRQGRFKVQLL